MAKLWLTYAWDDNKQQDVDFVAQELINAGLTVKLDRWTIRAGLRLWEQIEEFIQDPPQCDAWAIYATQNSLGSEPCKEEYAYALDRALDKRGGTFPIIGIFPSSIDRSTTPAGLLTRLCVSLRDHDWKERVVASTEGRAPAIPRASVEPYAIRMFRDGPHVVIEVRPRAGSWYPFRVAVPLADKDNLYAVGVGPTGLDTRGGTYIVNDYEAEGHFFHVIQSEVTPTQSAYIRFHKEPSFFAFGAEGDPNMFTSTLRR